MKVMGISFFSGGFQYAIFEKTGDDIIYIERVKCINPAPERIRECSEWIYDTLDEVFGRYEIARVGFKLHFVLKSMKDLYAHGAPIGILGYICSEKSIPLEGYTVRKIKSYKFLNLTKGANTLDWLDDNRNDGNLYWDNNARYAIAIAYHRALET